MTGTDREMAIASIMQEVADNPAISVEDLHKMVGALASHRDRQHWWFRNENSEGAKRCLSPMVLHNMKLMLENGTLEPSMMQFKNLLISAIHYQRAASQDTST